ncbi:MAG: hypothetical protein VZR95_05385 [Alphaproteobacteria bacterium]
MFLDIYNAMSDAENGFDSGALDRLTGNSGCNFDDEDDFFDDIYTPEELRARGLLKDDEDDDDY